MVSDVGGVHGAWVVHLHLDPVPGLVRRGDKRLPVIQVEGAGALVVGVPRAEPN